MAHTTSEYRFHSKSRSSLYPAALAAALCACVVPGPQSNEPSEASRAESAARPTVPADPANPAELPDPDSSDAASHAAVPAKDSGPPEAGATAEPAPDAAIVDADADDSAAPEHDGGFDAAVADPAACGTCPPELPHCKDGACVACTEDAHCETGVCRQNECVECGQDSDCKDPAASRCMALQCVPCSEPANCAHIDGKPACDSGECVQCTGQNYGACGRIADGTPYVCDSLARTCTTHLYRTAGLCDPCVSDKQCAAGQLCVMQYFDEVGDTNGDVEVGHFCVWREDATERLAPAGSCANVRPFLDRRAASVSIDGRQAATCGLRATTCASFRGQQPCSGTLYDASCGDLRFETDAYCRQVATSRYLCSLPCWSDDDCMTGMTCDVTATPPYCRPQ